MVTCPKCGEKFFPTTKQVSPELEARWKVFWKDYPRKRGLAPALKSFKTLDPNEELFEVMMTALKIQKEVCREIKYFPYPATWLNQKRWEDETEEEKDELERWAAS